MKIFVQDEDGKLQETNLRDLIALKLAQDLDYKKSTAVDCDKYTDGSGSWVEIEHDCDDKKVSIILSFDDAGEEFTDTDVYVTPIIRKPDEDKIERLT